MSNNRASLAKLKMISEPIQEMHQLDLLSFVSDYTIENLSAKEKPSRSTQVNNNVHRASALLARGDVNKNKTFSNLCIGNTNRLGVEAIKRFMASENSNFAIIYLKAASGLGKTHILHAVANELIGKNKSFYLSSPQIMSSLNNNFNSLKFFDVLLIDDLEEIEGNSEIQKTLCQLIDYAQNGKMKIIVTGSKLPKDLITCEDRLKGKLSAGQIQNFFELSSELAYDIVHKKCLAIDLELPPNVKRLVSRQVDFNVYGLESLLNKLKCISEIRNQEINIEIALKEISAKEKVYHQEDFQVVLKQVADLFQVNFEDLVSNKRRKDFVLARHVAMFILKEKLALSIMRISELFAKDHSSVIYAITSIKRQLEFDDKIRNKVQILLTTSSI